MVNTALLKNLRNFWSVGKNVRRRERSTWHEMTEIKGIGKMGEVSRNRECGAGGWSEGGPLGGGRAVEAAETSEGGASSVEFDAESVMR